MGLASFFTGGISGAAMSAAGKKGTGDSSGTTDPNTSKSSVDDIISQLAQASTVGKILSIIMAPQKTTPGVTSPAAANTANTSAMTGNGTGQGNPMIINPTINYHAAPTALDAADTISSSNASDTDFERTPAADDSIDNTDVSGE